MFALVAHLVDSESEENAVFSQLGPLLGNDLHLLILRSGSVVRSSEHFTVLSPPSGLKSGAQQKIVFEFASQLKPDVVCVIESGLTPPAEELRRAIEKFKGGPTADALYAERVPETVPLYHAFGAWCLRTIHRMLVGKRLRDIHSAYRLYRLSSLAEIPLDQNSDGRLFLIEITIQLLLAGKTIEEIPSTVSSSPKGIQTLFPMALGILGVSLIQSVQRLGILYDTRFDLSRENEYYTAKFDFPSSHSFAVQALKEGENVLLLGSGPAELVKPFLKKTKNISAIDQFAAPALMEICIEAKDLDLNSVDEFESSLQRIDKVYALDIIEHLVSPERFLTAIRVSRCTAGARVVITTPNIAFFPIRLMLLFGQFNYGKRGILDRTHTRLFTFASMRRLLEQQGYQVLEMKGVPAPFPLALGRNVLADSLLALNLALIQLSRGLFSFQIYLEASPLPTAKQLLSLSQFTESDNLGPVAAER